MTDEPDEQPVPDLTVAHSTPLYYANVAQMYAGPYDLTMEFGHKHPELTCYRALSGDLPRSDEPLSRKDVTADTG
jgi:hypothetical protein